MKQFLKAPIELRNGYKHPARLAAIHEIPCVVCEKLGVKQRTKTIAHHIIGNGIGKKASDLLTIALCDAHHDSGGSGVAIHKTPLWQWEEMFGTQKELLDKTNQLLESLKDVQL